MIDPVRARQPRGLLALIVSGVLSLGGGAGTGWLVVDTKMAWIRADQARTEQIVHELQQQSQQQGQAVADFHARIDERVQAIRAELAALRGEATETRRLLEILRWRGR